MESDVLNRDSNIGDKDVVNDLEAKQPDQAKLPLPSNLGHDKCMAISAHHLIKQELKLHAGQANDALHEIQLTLADKAVLFHTNIRHASSHVKTTQAWGKVNAMDALLTQQVAIYWKC